MFSQTTEYALRAMVALMASDGRPTTARQIAAAMKMPPSYLSKVLQALVRAGLVRSLRGLGGGFVLARPPQELPLLDVINAVTPIRRIRSCPLDLGGHNPLLCPLHQRLDAAVAQVQQVLGEATLAEVMSEQNPCPTLQTQLRDLQAMLGGKLQKSP